MSSPRRDIVEIDLTNKPLDGTVKLVGTLVRHAERLKLSVKRMLRVEKLGKQRGEDHTFIALDSAFSPTPLDLVGISIAIISSAKIIAKNDRLTSKSFRDIMLASSSREIEPERIIERARLLERHEVLKTIWKMRREGIKGLIIVFDGEAYIDVNKFKYYSKAVTEVQNEILEHVEEADYILAGVIKRSYSKYLADVLGIPTSLNDKAVLSLTLERGEYVVLAKNTVKNLQAYTIFYKPWRGSNQVVKLEVINVDENRLKSIVSIMANCAGYTGYPWFIDMVDSLAKTRFTKLTNMIQNYIQHLSASNKAYVLGEKTNLQEKSNKPPY
ncbi:MAG: DNA double-strand break repair nuclease NurA [Pyrodictiaceae archaeon]